MVATRGILLAMQVWLTAFLTLLSGVPRFSCECPDGSVQSSFLGIVLGGACSCAPRQDAPPLKSCCAAHAAGSSRPASPLQRPQCRKSVASSDATKSAPAQTVSDAQ